MNKQKGFTLVELFVVLGFFGIVVPLIGGSIWVAIHFISKYW